MSRYFDKACVKLGLLWVHHMKQVTNAVHCTDLPDDGLLECRFMFDIIASSRHF